MAISQLLIGNDNDIIVQPFQEAFTGDVESAAEIYATVCQNISGSITNATNASPIVITTSVAHGLTTGDTVAVIGVGGNGAATGTHQVTVLSATTFSLDGSTGDGAYTQGGVWCQALEDALAQEIELTAEGSGTYRGILSGLVGLVNSTQYLVAIYCHGAYRDKYSELCRAVAKIRGGGLG
jgi:hypothetical protein